MSRSFNGTSAALTSNTSPITGFPFTLAVWYKPATLSGSDKDLISLHDDPSVPIAVRLVLRSAASWKPTLYLFDGGYKEINSGGSGSTTGAWQLAVAVVNSASSYSVFYNGANKATGTTPVTMTLSNLDRLAIGKSSFGAEYFEGLLGYAAAWNGVALSDAQVAALYTQSPLLVGTPTAVWPLISNASPEPDSVGSNTLTVTAATFSTDNPPISTISVTDVDTDESIRSDQTGIVITGTGFGATQGTGSVTITQGAVTVAQTVTSWSATSIQFSTAFEASPNDLKFGAATLRVTENGGTYAEIGITITPPTGQTYVAITSVNATPGYRFVVSPDLAVGDQVWARGLGGTAAPGGLTLNADGTFYFASGSPTGFEILVWNAASASWGSWLAQGFEASTAASGNAVCESVCVIPAPDRARDELWLIVKRTVNGVQRRYVEYLEREFAEGDSQASAYYVDCGATYSGAPATTISGLGYLEGQTVQVLADGAAHPDRTVSSGTITLQVAASTVHVGLGYASTVQTNRIEAGAGDGTAQGKTKRINKMVLRFYNTLGGKAGPDALTLDEIQFREASNLMDAPPPLFTGDKLMEWPGTYDFNGYVMVRQEQPLPMTVVSLMPLVHTFDR
ncbi:MAG: hypothetical protein RI988_738 [Pseudomonadota bacterium]|jgi:hypothetical protein